MLLMAGVAAGFGAVFGTPLAGAVFAMEVLAIGRMSYESLVPCLAASVVGDCTVPRLGHRPLALLHYVGPVRPRVLHRAFAVELAVDDARSSSRPSRSGWRAFCSPN